MSQGSASLAGVNWQLFLLRLPNQPGSVRVAQATVEAQLRELAFRPQDIDRLTRAVGAAAVNVVQHAYGPGEQQTFDVVCLIEYGKLKIRIQDHGLPYDPTYLPPVDSSGSSPQLHGLDLMHSLVHEIRFVNLGHEGKAVDLLYPLPGGWAEHPHAVHTEVSKDAATPVNPATLLVRLFRPEDAEQVARCAYHVYGYSYFGEHIYIPERLIAMNQAGDLVSAVVADQQGNVFGHLALVYSPSRVIPEEGQAFVMPEARGGGWLKRMKAFLYDVAKQRGLPGVFSDGVTVHPYTQRANLVMNSRECGILPAFAPGNVQFKELHQADDFRHSLVVFYKPLEEQQHGRGYLPPKHAGIIHEIYENLGVDLEVLDQPQPLAAASVLDITCNPSRGIAYVTVKSYGADLIDQVHHQLQLLLYHGTSVIQLDLPMNHPAAADQAESIEQLGFFFVAVVPHYFGDSPTLRFQYLNHVEIHATSVVLESPFAKRLFAYILDGICT